MIVTLKPFVAALLDAEDRRLDPPAELDVNDCPACAGTGQSINADFPGEFFICAECRGTGASDLPPDIPCRCGDVCRC